MSRTRAEAIKAIYDRRARGFALRSAVYSVVTIAATAGLDHLSTTDGVAIWFVPAALALAYLVLVGAAGTPVVALVWAFGADSILPATIDDVAHRVALGVLAAASYGLASAWIRRNLDTGASSLRAASIVAAGSLGAAITMALTTTVFLVSTPACNIGDSGVLFRSSALGAAAAGMTVAPWLLLIHRRRQRDPHVWGLAGRVETLLQAALLIGATWVALIPTPEKPQFYVVVVPIVWVAIRGGMLRTTVAIAVAAGALTTFATINEITSGDLFRIQMFMIVLASTGMLLGATESDRRAALRAVVRAEATQRASLDSLEQGIAVSDLTGRVKLLNPAGRRILGYEPDRLTHLFQTGQWESYREDGTVLPPDERPIGMTMRTGRAVTDRVVAWQRADGSLVTLRVATQPLHDERGRLDGVVTAFADITAQRATERAEKQAVEALHWQATHDPLTGLANRSLLVDELEATLADRRVRGLTGLLFLDLDHFKAVNDTHGHGAGDELLVGVATRLERAVRGGDLVARFGGDEFVILARNLADVSAVEILADRIHAELAAPIALATGPTKASASIGIAIADGHSADALLHDADAALYRAKGERRGSYQISV